MAVPATTCAEFDRNHANPTGASVKVDQCLNHATTTYYQVAISASASDCDATIRSSPGRGDQIS
ncbi:MAG: hypothetical protein R2828_04535 [Saprospiraceae bacterium]